MQSDLYFDCDNCEIKFSIGQGFLGSKEDFKVFVLSKIKQKKIRHESTHELECNPHMLMVSLCNNCIKKYK